MTEQIYKYAVTPGVGQTFFAVDQLELIAQMDGAQVPFTVAKVLEQ